MNAQPTAWTCHARPAATGRTCFAVNAGGIRKREAGLCCSTCGATKRAGDDRLSRGDVDRVRATVQP